MKKLFSIIACALLTLALGFSLVACSTLSGTYSASGLLADKTYEFSGNNVKEITMFKSGSTTVEVNYTYKVGKDDQGNETITFTKVSKNSDGDTTTTETTYSFNRGKDNDGEYIVIDGTTYYKK